MGVFSDWLGTLRDFIRIGPPSAAATIDVSGLTAPRTFELPDASGTIALVGGAGAPNYEPVTNGDPDSPELLFDDTGDVVMAEVFYP